MNTTHALQGTIVITVLLCQWSALREPTVMKQLVEISLTVFHVLQDSIVQTMPPFMVHHVILVLHALKGQYILLFVHQDITVLYLKSSYLVHLVIIALRGLLVSHYVLMIITVEDLIVLVALRVNEGQTDLWCVP